MITEVKTQCQDLSIIDNRKLDLQEIIFEQSTHINELLKIVSRITSEIQPNTEIPTSTSEPVNGILTNDLTLYVEKFKSNTEVIKQIVAVLKFVI